jgi:hypothetical protein
MNPTGQNPDLFFSSKSQFLEVVYSTVRLDIPCLWAEAIYHYRTKLQKQLGFSLIDIRVSPIDAGVETGERTGAAGSLSEQSQVFSFAKAMKDRGHYVRASKRAPAMNPLGDKIQTHFSAQNRRKPRNVQVARTRCKR